MPSLDVICNFRPIPLCILLESAQVNGSVYAFEPVIYDAIRTGDQSLTDGIDELLATDRSVRSLVLEVSQVDATYPWDLPYVSFGLFEQGVISGRHEDYVVASVMIHESAVLIPATTAIYWVL